MIFKAFVTFSILFSFHLQSQRRNFFPDSDTPPNCNIIKKGTFFRDDKTDSRFKVKFHNNKMIEVYGNNTVIIESNLKMLSKCKFEGEIKKIKTKFLMTDSLFYVGKTTTYEIVETGKNYIVYEYPCVADLNNCTEILEKK
ncbi:hypothetical protein [Chryseobacterium geocarposphaerae]|uniref:Uncharacterized protein n=1 Tax=Chryseobacterium geocarposphaerae TaxID=1416776 RepID=A0A2M9CAP1_9FLAO|nr:hypothetical protein [Chryseobacterium geocarposphaerae]PJJ67887.1 hypothetical protein CLV73_1907 [Chryseobacterium geocarposphaerae]